jgi:predicted nucleotidyltransferase
VRILRALSQHQRPLGTTELAARTKLNESGLRRALSSLVEAGLVESNGARRGATHTLASTHPLHASLNALFNAESQRVTRVIDAVRHAAEGMTPSVLAVWLYGSVVRGDDASGSDLDVAVVTAREDVRDKAVEALRMALAPIEEAERVNIAVLGLSGADILRLAAGDPWWISVRNDAIPLVGAAPEIVRQRLAADKTRGRKRARA